MMRFILAVAVAFSVLTGYAAAADRQKVTEGCRAVLEKNFQALVYEDADSLMSTLSPKMGTPEQRDEFRNEAEKMFSSTDVYVRLDELQVYKVEGPYAYARVLQYTAPKNAEDHYPSQQGKLNFKHHSALLPEHQLVQYEQRFKLEKGKWYVDLIVSQPQPLKAQSQCPDGKCEPFIKVKR
jgi:uncharacterized protein YchJ